MHTRGLPLQMDMQLFHSSQVEPLLVQLSQRLSTPLDDPFAAEIVVGTMFVKTVYRQD